MNHGDNTDVSADYFIPASRSLRCQRTDYRCGERDRIFSCLVYLLLCDRLCWSASTHADWNHRSKHRHDALGYFRIYQQRSCAARERGPAVRFQYILCYRVAWRVMVIRENNNGLCLADLTFYWYPSAPRLLGLEFVLRQMHLAQVGHNVIIAWNPSQKLFFFFSQRHIGLSTSSS